MHKIFYIGGPLDGKRELVKNLSHNIKTMSLLPPNYTRPIESKVAVNDVIGVEVTYYLYKFFGANVYFSEVLTPNQVINILLNNYYPKGGQ
jgi:hypothetical protein